MVYIKNILKFVRHHSLLELFRRIWLAATKSFFESRAMFIVTLSPEASIGLDVCSEVKELTSSEIDEMLEVMYLSRADINDRFNRGQRCFAIWDGGKIVSFFWVQFGIRRLLELHWEFNLKPNQAWMYNAITVKTARGRGCYPNIIRHIANVLRAEGFDEFFIDIEERNKASIRSTEKAGCRQIVKVKMKKLLRKAEYRITIFDKEAWQRLSGTINNFSERKYIKEYTLNGNYNS